MAISIKRIRGVSPDLKAALNRLGIFTNEQLLASTRTREGCLEIAERLAMAEAAVDRLAHRADMSRVTGIGGVYTDLLELAGVGTLAELTTRRPEPLHARLLQINGRLKLTTKPPTRGMVKEWIFQAQELPPVLQYC